MDADKLKEILESHGKWLNNDGGIRAYLCGADLCGADLRGAYLDERTVGLDISCPEEGAFIGYKKAAGKIVVLEIAADSRRSSATTRKCRCSKAKVLRIEEINGSVSDVNSVPSNRDRNFIYEVGETVEVKDFDDNRWNECSTGIHFFINKEAARRY